MKSPATQRAVELVDYYKCPLIRHIQEEDTVVMPSTVVDGIEYPKVTRWTTKITCCDYTGNSPDVFIDVVARKIGRKKKGYEYNIRVINCNTQITVQATSEIPEHMSVFLKSIITKGGENAAR